MAAEDNWDAAWVFVKYRLDGGDWRHATLDPGRYHVPPDAVVDVPAEGKGAFVYRASPGYGTFSARGVTLPWKADTDGVTDDATLDVSAFAVEMVFVPQGPFALGSGGSRPGEFRAGGAPRAPFFVEGPSPIGLGDSPGNLFWDTPLGQQADMPTASTRASFPSGYEAYYVMKYQVTQGQYVDFLNTLRQSQADARLPTVSGSRYAITGAAVGSYTTSLPFVAMPWLSWADGAAYADWAGLRPMTELEFEKLARGPVAPIAHEYAWGSFSITPATGLQGAGTPQEVLEPANANATYDLHLSEPGPARAGAFAAPGRSRRDAGAGYYGALELSGNLWERVVTVANAEGRAFSGLHGDGQLHALGGATVPGWPGSSAIGAGFRGGSWDSQLALLRVSDRSRAAHVDSQRSDDHGFRAARTAPSPHVTATPGVTLPEPGVDSDHAAAVVVTITPPHADLTSNASRTFTATVTGTSDTRLR